MIGSRVFWSTQILGWTLMTAAAIGPRIVRDLDLEQAPLDESIAIFALCVGLGIAASTGLGGLYQALPNRWITRPGAGFWVAGGYFGASLLLGIPCASAMRHAWASTTWQSPGYVDNVYDIMLPFFTFSLFGWSYIHQAVRSTRHLQQVRERLLESQAQSKEARLQALRSQINPHFLFNSLNSVIGLVEVDPGRAKDMLRDLSRLLRTALETAEQTTTTLDLELDFVLRYLQCEQVRFGAELHLRVDIDERLSSASVPSLLLQPLVENAVKHGMTGQRALLVELRAEQVGSCLTLEVANTGSLVRTPTPANGSGLRLVRERLATRYPRTGTFTLIERDQWVVARITYDTDERLPDEIPSAAK
ncbi:MAG: histidine kinase [Myxococcota bacterium]